MNETRKAREQIDLIRQLLDNGHSEARKAVQGLLKLVSQGILKPGIQVLERIEPETLKEAQTLPNDPETRDRGSNTLGLIKLALKLIKDSGLKTPAKKLVGGLMELINTGVISHTSLQEMEKLDKRTTDKAQLTPLSYPPGGKLKSARPVFPSGGEIKVCSTSWRN